MNNQERFYKCEYENLRRKKNKEITQLTNEIEKLKTYQVRFADITYKLLNELGMSNEDIIEYYQLHQEKTDIKSQENRKAFYDMFKESFEALDKLKVEKK